MLNRLSSFFKSEARIEKEQFFEAVAADDVARVDSYFKSAFFKSGKFDPNQRDDKGRTALFIAAERGFTSSFIDIKGKSHETAAMVKLLLANGANPHLVSADEDGYFYAPISIAAERGHHLVVKELLRNGAKYEPLFGSITNNRVGVVRYQLENPPSGLPKDEFINQRLDETATPLFLLLKLD